MGLGLSLTLGMRRLDKMLGSALLDAFFACFHHGDEKTAPIANIGDEISRTSRPINFFKIKPFLTTNYLSDTAVVGC